MCSTPSWRRPVYAVLIAASALTAAFVSPTLLAHGPHMRHVTCLHQMYTATWCSQRHMRHVTCRNLVQPAGPLRHPSVTKSLPFGCAQCTTQCAYTHVMVSMCIQVGFRLCTMHYSMGTCSVQCAYTVTHKYRYTRTRSIHTAYTRDGIYGMCIQVGFLMATKEKLGVIVGALVKEGVAKQVCVYLHVCPCTHVCTCACV